MTATSWGGRGFPRSSDVGCCVAERRIERGIYRDDVTGRWRVYVSVGGRLRPKRLPRTYTLAQARRAREDHAYLVRHEPATAAGGEPVPAHRPTFADDAAAYLHAVQALPTYRTRARHIAEWVALFGPRWRDTIRPHEIRAQRDRWLLEGPRLRQRVTRIPGARALVEWVPVAAPLSASAVNHRLRALSNLWTVLDGRHAYNPVREVPEADPPADEARGLPYAVAEAILDALGDSDTRVRLEVMLFTGLAHCELARLTARDVDLEARTLFVRPRRKGKRGKRAAAEGLVKPVPARGVEALRRFAARKLWGEFSRSSMRKSFLIACREAGYRELGARPYDFRHTFATGVYGASGDPAATQLLMGHRDLRTTMRYARAAVNPRAAAALAAFEADLTHGKAPSTAGPTESDG